MCVLDGTNTLSLIRPGHECTVRSAQFIRRWGLFRESVPGQSIGDEKVLTGRHLNRPTFHGMISSFLGGLDYQSI